MSALPPRSARTAVDAPRLRRRTLTALLAASGGALLVTGCGPSPVATSSDIPRDPLSALDPALWDARTAEELRALPVQGDAGEIESWGDLGADDATLDPARDALTTFVSACFLDPVALRGLDEAASLEAVTAAAPEYWADPLSAAWDDGLRPLYAFAPAEQFRSVGHPLLCADWVRTERDGEPSLVLGAVIAWSVIDTTTHGVGLVAYQVAANMTLDGSGKPTAGSLRVVVHGLDGCASDETGGQVVPAIADDEQHRELQQTVTEHILADPRIPQEILFDEDADLYDVELVTYLGCE